MDRAVRTRATSSFWQAEAFKWKRFPVEITQCGKAFWEKSWECASLVGIDMSKHTAPKPALCLDTWTPVDQKSKKMQIESSRTNQEPPGMKNEAKNWTSSNGLCRISPKTSQSPQASLHNKCLGLQQSMIVVLCGELPVHNNYERGALNCLHFIYA